MQTCDVAVPFDLKRDCDSRELDFNVGQAVSDPKG
jgi:hypothetical protein